MKVAVTYDNGQIFAHFGRTEQFKVYVAEGGQIVEESVIDTNGNGHGALAGFLAQNGIDVLICGGIGQGAKTALEEAGIKLCGGVCGSADDAVRALLSGTLNFDEGISCDHHEHEHNVDEHACGHGGCHLHN